MLPGRHGRRFSMGQCRLAAKILKHYSCLPTESMCTILYSYSANLKQHTVL